MSAAFSFSALTYTYPGGARPALADVNLTIGEGEVCLLAGGTGSGKSTFLRAACGLVPHFHGGSFAGRVEVRGLNTRDHAPAQLGSLLGVLTQDPESQIVSSSVRAEIAIGLQARGASSQFRARAVEEVALALGIDHLLERSTLELSGGEKQRVALAAALAGRPHAVLLDEPTSQLDPVAGDELIGLLRRLNRDWGLTVLIAEHRIERCLPDVDRVLVFADARIAFDGSPRTFLRWAAERAPQLQSPGARLFSLAGLQARPLGVREAREELARAGLDGALAAAAAAAQAEQRLPVQGDAGERMRDTDRRRNGNGGRKDDRAGQAALRMRSLWHEKKGGRAILRAIELRIQPGERVALLGRNGSGKSTLLRHAAALLEPSRGRIERGGRVALLLQDPGDYLLRDRVREEASPAALERFGLTALATRNPRELSGGERQRLALAIVSDWRQAPVLIALDEPTRGMDSAAKSSLAADLRMLAEQGSALLLATHDPEFAAACAERALLLADGRIIADAPCSELLCGGWYFATETARILAGPGERTGDPGAASSPPLLPEQAALLLRDGRARLAGRASGAGDGA